MAKSEDLNAILGPVLDDLDSVSVILAEVLRAPSGKVRPLLDHVGQFKGKMLRPAFTVLAGRCFGEIERAHHQLGAVVELIHTATLVHDDVLDEAAMRRGLQTTNKLWGNRTSILLGDYLFATAFSLSASLDNPLASRYLSWITGVVCQGEILQNLEAGNLDLSEEVYLDVIEKKTAYLIAASLRVGAEYADAPQPAVQALTDYGMKLGTAFQIIDDCLDLAGDEGRVGKTLGTDARLGKVTLPVIQFLRTAPADRREHLRSLFADHDNHRQEIRGMLEESGALGWAREQAVRYAEEATKGVVTNVPESEYRTTLEKLADYTLTRSR